MKKRNQRNFCVTICLYLLFILWTAAIKFFDIAAVGPEYSEVGFASVNVLFHRLTGVNMLLYTITDWLGLVPVCFVLGFALLGLIQLIKRKSLLKVDCSILLLGGFYVLVMAAYVFFEIFIINYRPVMIAGQLEASYPSSTTMLAMCVMPTAVMQLNSRIKNDRLKKCVVWVINAFTVFMVIGRLISGVHWLTDIIGGALLSAGLVMTYYLAEAFLKEECKNGVN